MLKQSWYLTYGSHASKETVKDRLSADFDMCFERCEGHYQHSERPSRRNEKNTLSCKPIAYKYIYFFHQGVQNSYVKIFDNYIEALNEWYHPNKTYQTIIELAFSGATNEENKSNYQFFKNSSKKTVARLTCCPIEA